MGESVQGKREAARIDEKGLAVVVHAKGRVLMLGDAHVTSVILRGRDTPGSFGGLAPIWRVPGLMP
ncbi:hypothetical protein GCM10023171_14030 [Microbacterium panaciterrae]|uniref:Uncharacterized protein n=1 Tax=Microbacterium panaciterrae TaxID=985759 RepID=A0ABP8P7C6_9MICO